MAKWEIIEDNKFKKGKGGKTNLNSTVEKEPKNTVKVNQNGQIIEYDPSSPEYKKLYESGTLTSYDPETDAYITPTLKEFTVVGEKPKWAKEKENNQNKYSKDWYIDNYLPKFSRNMGISADNMNPNDVERYNSFINDKTAEDIFKRYPTFDSDYANDRLGTLKQFSPKEVELIKNSSYASALEPNVWDEFKQAASSAAVKLLTSQVPGPSFPNPYINKNLTYEEAQEASSPLNLLAPLSIPYNMTTGNAYTQQQGEKNYSWLKALKGQKPIHNSTAASIAGDPLNLLGLGLFKGLVSAGKIAKLEDAYQLVKGLGKEEALSKLKSLTNLDNIGKNSFTPVLDNVGVEALGAIDYRNNPISDEVKEMYKRIDDEMRFSNLPQTTNKQSLGVLEDFKTRIQTPEGQKRMKELGITEKQFLQDLKIVEDPNTFGYYTNNRNKIVMNPNSPLPKKVVRHEIEHGVQNAITKGRLDKLDRDVTNFRYLFRPKKEAAAAEEALKGTSEIDDILSEIELRKEGTPDKTWDRSKVTGDKPVDISQYKSAILNKQNATDYFLTGSEGKEKSAFLAEVQQYMMDQGIIPKNSYTEVTPEMVHDVFVDAMFDEEGGGKYLRLFNIMKPTETNYKLISKGLNKMLGLTGTIGVGLGAASALQQKKHGGIIEDPMGQWAHPGSVTRIPSNQITMQGVNYPVLGISDRGHTQMMYPGEDYSFRGKSVTEYPMMAGGGEVNFTYAGENHRVYEKESPTGNGKGIEGHIMVNHPTENKGKWDTIDLTKITNGKVKTVAQGVASTKKWHKENPEYADGGMIKRADGSYSKRGLWDNIRDNAGSGKKPTKEMLKQERKIKSQYANGGKVSSWEIIEDLPKAGNGLISEITSTLNPKNWGVKDYTKSGTRDQAYSAAKKAGEEEFMYNGKRYNTKYAGTPAQEMKSYGITQEQRVFNPSTTRKNLGRLNTEKGYKIEPSKVFKQLFNSKNPEVVNNEEPGAGIEKDAFRLYLGLPQKMNSFTPSKYQKGAFEIVNYNQMLPEVLDENIENLIKTKGSPEKESKYEEHVSGEANPIKPLGDYVMGKHTVKKGEDDKGEYIEYIDNWDLDSYKMNPFSLLNKGFKNYDNKIGFKLSKYLNHDMLAPEKIDVNVPVGAVADMVNKPFPIYGRVYYKDYGDGVKKKMYYTDNELKSFSTDKNNKNFNTLDLQKELVNRGYELPNSIQQDDYGNLNFDGIYGNETKKALQDFQNKKVEAPKMAVQKPGQSIALPPQFKKGGKTKKSNWQIIEY